MNRNYFYWIVAAAGACIALVAGFMWQEKQAEKAPPARTSLARPSQPFQSSLTAVGIVEPSSENINIGSPVNRVIDKVDVIVGQKVKKGDILFRLESRDLTAELQTQKLAYENAQANLKKLQALPRAQDVAAAAAALKSVQVDLEQAKTQYERVAGLQNSGAMSQEEVMRRKFIFEDAEAKLQQAQADFDKIKAGAWAPDLTIAKLQVEQAKASMERVQVEIERTIIRSPIDATVLQIKIHEGEFPPCDASRVPLMIVGNVDVMHLRVSINQFDASYFNPKAPAVAFLQGNPHVEFPLEFVEIEPYFVTKQNLTNDITEKVDTRVLQVIYAFKEKSDHVYVGQQMDVFIKNSREPKE